VSGTVRIGVDLGGTKIEAAAMDAAGGLLARKRVATPQGDYGATLACIVGLVEELERSFGTGASVGIATPGALSPATGLLRNANSICLNGKPFLEDIEARLQRPVRMANDADCFALSEAVDGAAAGAASVFGVIVGTGTGGGVVIGGRLLWGINAIAGEWGHNPLPWPSPDELPGEPCYCGKQGCVETWLSGPALEREYRRESGRWADAVAIAAAAEAGEDAARSVLARYVDRMARSLAIVINLLDPEVIVLGGGVGNIRRLYEDVPACWGEYVFSDCVRTRLVAPRHGDSSGVRGAAWLWPA
jgi:fructokinase